jgi:hypothetical protein
MKEVIMKKLLFWLALIVSTVALIGSCAKKDESTTTTAAVTSTTASGSITFGSETMSGTYVSPCYSGAEVAAAASAGQLPPDLLAMRDVLVVTSDTSISEETHAYTDTTCSTLSYYSKDGNTSFTVGDPSGDYYKVTYTETGFALKAGTAAAKTWWEARYTAAGESIDLTVGTELSGTGSGKNELNLFSVTSTTVQHGDDDNETYPTAMDSQVMTKQ